MTWDLADENEKNKMSDKERVELYEWAQSSDSSQVQAETKELFAKLPVDLQEEAKADSMIMAVRAESQKESDAIVKSLMGARECVSMKGKPADGKLLRFHAVRNVGEKDKKTWPEKLLTQDGKVALSTPEKGLGMEVVGAITIDTATMKALEGTWDKEELVHNLRKEGHKLILSSLNKQLHDKGEGLHDAMVKIMWNDTDETMSVLAVKSKTLIGLFSGLEIDKSESYGYFSFFDTGQKDDLKTEIARMKKALQPEMTQIMIFKAGRTSVIAPDNDEEKEEWEDLCNVAVRESLEAMGKDASGIACQYKDNFGGSGKKGPNAWFVLLGAPDLDWDARVELTAVFNKKISEATNHMKFYDSNGGRISTQCNMAWPSVVVQMAKNECWKFQRDDQCLDDKCPWNHSIDGQKGDGNAWWNPHLNGIGGWDNHEAAKQRRGGKGGKGKGFKGAGKGGKKGGKGKSRAGKGVKGGKGVQHPSLHPYTPTTSKSAGKKAAAPTSKTQSGILEESEDSDDDELMRTPQQNDQMAAMKKLELSLTQITERYDKRLKVQEAQTEVLSTGLATTQASLESLMKAIKEKIEEIETSLDENAKLSKNALEACAKQVKELEEKIELAKSMMEEQIEIEVKAELENMGIESVDTSTRTAFEETLKKMKRKELVDKISLLEGNLTNTKVLQQNEKAREEKQRECDKKVRHLGSTLVQSMNEMKGSKSIEGSKHDIDFDAEENLAGEGGGIEVDPEVSSTGGGQGNDTAMSPTSSTTDTSSSNEVGTPDSLSEDNGLYSPQEGTELTKHEISLLSAESLIQHNKNVEKGKRNEQYKANLLKRRTDGISPYSDGTYATTAETPSGAGGAGGAGQKQAEQNSTVKSLANSMETGADTPKQPILKFLGDKVQAAGRGKIVTTLPISEKELQQARTMLEAENTEREQVASAIKNSEQTASGGHADYSDVERTSRQRCNPRESTQNPNGSRKSDLGQSFHRGGGSSGNSNSGKQRKRSTEGEGHGSPAKVRKEDTPASKTAQGMEKLNMDDAAIVGKTVTAAVDAANSALEDGEVAVVAVVETNES